MVEAVSSMSSPASVLVTTSVLVQGTFTFESLSQPDSVTAFSAHIHSLKNLDLSADTKKPHLSEADFFKRIQLVLRWL